jgi:hypothetical protein
MRENPTVVARWVNEIQQALTSKSAMAQVSYTCVHHAFLIFALTTPYPYLTLTLPAPVPRAWAPLRHQAEGSPRRLQAGAQPDQDSRAPWAACNLPADPLGKQGPFFHRTPFLERIEANCSLNYVIFVRVLIHRWLQTSPTRWTRASTSSLTAVFATRARYRRGAWRSLTRRWSSMRLPAPLST